MSKSKIKYKMVNTKTNKLLKVNKKTKNPFRRQFGKHTFKGQKCVLRFEYWSSGSYGLGISGMYREYRPKRN